MFHLSSFVRSFFFFWLQKPFTVLSVDRKQRVKESKEIISVVPYKS